jgi:hypothetical protein
LSCNLFSSSSFPAGNAAVAAWALLTMVNVNVEV